MSVPSLSEVESMFSDIRSSGTTVDEPMQWSFFFTSETLSVLNSLAIEAAKLGYDAVGIGQAPNSSESMLKISQHQAHTPATLHGELERLHELANRNGLESIAGIDVRPPGA